jgi:hypothetical protein
MPLETVRVRVVDDSLIPEDVNGVVVRFYDASGTTLITEAVTGAVESGIAEVTLDGDDPPETYQLRFFLVGGRMTSPRHIAVYSPPALSSTGANNFEVTAHLNVLQSSPNPRLCRASGYVWGPDGRPRPGIDMHFIPCFNPLVVEGIGVLGERVAARTDKNGFISVDLIRHGMYTATVESHENLQRIVAVPDRGSVNISHLLFPVVAAVQYDPPGPWSIPRDITLEVIPEVVSTNFQVLTGTAARDVIYSTDDPNVAAVEVTATRIIIHARNPGTTALRIARRDRSIVYLPLPDLGASDVTITVT